MGSRRKAMIALGIGVAFAVAAGAFDAAGVFDGFERVTWDVRVRAMAQRCEAPVKLVLLDQGSLDWGERQGLAWPWPRDVYVYAIEFMKRGKARAVAWDVTFTEPHADAAADEAFAEAVGGADRMVLAVLASDKAGDATAMPADVRAARFEVAGLDTWRAGVGVARIDMPRAVLPIGPVLKGAAALGHVRGVIEPDYVIRRTLPVQVFDGRVMPSLGVAAYAMASGDDAAKPTAMRVERGVLRVGDASVPVDAEGRSILNYYRLDAKTGHAFEAVSLGDVLASEAAMRQGEKPIVDPAMFDGCVVFVGWSAPGLYDLKPTPLNPRTPGVEAHATAAANLFDGTGIAEAPRWLVIAATVLLALAGAAWTLAATRARQMAVATAVLGPVPVLMGFGAYAIHVWWPIVTPMAALAGSLVGGIVVNFATEGRQRRFIRRAFERYLNPAVVEQLVAEPHRLELGGERRVVTLMFADLAGFTTMSASMEPERLTAVLNTVLTDLTAVIFEHRGTLDKYIGDAIVAFWGAPMDQPDHAERAVRAAMACQRVLAERRGVYEELSGGCAIGMRIGLHTGPAIVGNMGSTQQFNYTALGDAVNVASRIEGTNKAFGTRVLVSEATREAAGGGVRMRRVAKMTVVGRSEPVVVYEPIGDAGATVDGAVCVAGDEAAVERYERAMELGASGRWAEAAAALAECEGDAVAAAYVGYLRAVDAAEWDGVWRMTKK